MFRRHEAIQPGSFFQNDSRRGFVAAGAPCLGEEQTFMSALLQFLDRRSRAVLAVLTLLFLSIEAYYAVHRPLSLDEFNGAWSVSQLATGVPYVLGPDLSPAWTSSRASAAKNPDCSTYG